MALLQYQRENLHFLSEEILRLQECLSKYESSDDGSTPQLLAMIREQFYYGDEICGAVVNVRARQEKISIWTKNAANEAAQGSAGVQTSLQKAATIPGPSGGIEKQNNAASSSSLIDFFDAESEPSSTPAQPQPHSTASNANNESSSSSTQTAANIQNLLLDWSSSVASPSSGTKAPETSNSFVALANDQQYHSEPKNPIVQDIQMHQLPTSPTPVESSSSPYWKKSPLSNDLRRVQSVPLEKPSHAINPEGSSPSARKEIPQDLFASPFNLTVGGWPTHQPQGAAYDMQFHHPMMG